MGNLLAITPNFTIDHMISVAELIPGEVHRAENGKRIPGGKGVNVARIMRQLGHQADLAGFLGGHNGQFAAKHFTAERFTGHYVWYDGETRTSILIDEPDGRTTVINERGTFIENDAVGQLARLVKANRDNYQWMSFSGSILPGAPADMYSAVFKAARPAKIALDSHGKPLSVLARANPDLLKINGLEASVLLGKPINSVDAARKACLELAAWGIEMVVISLGALGAVGVYNSKLYTVAAPHVSVVSTVGAGDALLGGMLAALMDGAEFSEALRRGVAVGAACCTVREVGVLPTDNYQHLLTQVFIH